jgi:tRNA U38,U39,U40 pseudouridine synthase TruA|tara:strand:- start:187 stop:1311 length:1125 start_codon:yes stop_codon:yes gene_type:complete
MAFQSSVNPAQLTQLGQSNLAGDTRALYLKLFSGEMFKGFQHNTIARDLIMKRTIKNGKSLQFIYTGRTKSEFHTPGNSILGDTNNAPPVAEKTITIDDLLISSAFVYELDEVLAHYDLRSEISRKIGYALAEKYDRLAFRAVARGARQASPVSATGYVEPGGTQIRVGSTTNDSDAFNSSNLVAAFYDAAAALDEKGVSSDGRVAVLNPRQYYELIQAVGSNGLVNRDVQGTALQSGQGIIEIAGIKVFKSMNIPFLGKYGTAYGGTTGQTSPGNTGSFVGESLEDASGASTGINNDYGTAAEVGSKSCGLIFQKEAAGMVEAIGPQVQVTSGDVSVIYQGDVMLGRLACGADYLNPAAAVELYVGATAPSAF